MRRAFRDEQCSARGFAKAENTILTWRARGKLWHFGKDGISRRAGQTPAVQNGSVEARAFGMARSLVLKGGERRLSLVFWVGSRKGIESVNKRRRGQCGDGDVAVDFVDDK